MMKGTVAKTKPLGPCWTTSLFGGLTLCSSLVQLAELKHEAADCFSWMDLQTNKRLMAEKLTLSFDFFFVILRNLLVDFGRELQIFVDVAGNWILRIRTDRKLLL